MTIFESIAVAFTIYAGILVWLAIDTNRIHVETQRFLLARAKARTKPVPAIPVRRAVRV